jgi:hypothetical protein
MDANTILLVLGAIAAFIIHRWTSSPSARQVNREPAGEATLEKCPYCNAIVGITSKGATLRLSKKDSCPHCSKKIRR